MRSGSEKVTSLLKILVVVKSAYSAVMSTFLIWELILLARIPAARTRKALQSFW